MQSFIMQNTTVVGKVAKCVQIDILAYGHVSNSYLLIKLDFG